MTKLEIQVPGVVLNRSPGFLKSGLMAGAFSSLRPEDKVV